MTAAVPARPASAGATGGSAALRAIEAIRVLAMLRRRREDGDPAFRDRCRSEVWELPLAEVQFCTPAA